MNKTILFTLAALVVGFGLGYLVASNNSALGQIGGYVRTTADHFYAGANFGSADQSSFNSTGGLVLGSGGTAQTAHKCVTFTWTVPAMGAFNTATSVTSTAVAVSGALMTDRCTVSISSSTTAFDSSCRFSASGTSTIFAYNNSGSAVTVGAASTTVCYDR